MNNCLGRTNDRTIAMTGFRILKLAETPSFIMTIFWFSPLLTEHVVACEKNLVLFSDRHEMVASGTWRLTTELLQSTTQERRGSLHCGPVSYQAL